MFSRDSTTAVIIRAKNSSRCKGNDVQLHGPVRRRRVPNRRHITTGESRVSLTFRNGPRRYLDEFAAFGVWDPGVSVTLHTQVSR